MSNDLVLDISHNENDPISLALSLREIANDLEDALQRSSLYDQTEAITAKILLASKVLIELGQKNLDLMSRLLAAKISAAQKTQSIASILTIADLKKTANALQHEVFAQNNIRVMQASALVERPETNVKLFEKTLHEAFVNHLVNKLIDEGGFVLNYEPYTIAGEVENAKYTCTLMVVWPENTDLQVTIAQDAVEQGSLSNE